jgi:hypothetical protein
LWFVQSLSKTAVDSGLQSVTQCAMETDTAPVVIMPSPPVEPIRRVAALVTLAAFSPDEAAQITGVAATTQRAWRARGWMPDQGGRWQAKHSVFAVARLLTLAQLSRRAGMRDIAAAAEAASYAVAWFALGWENSWDGSVRSVGSWDTKWAAQALAMPDRGWGQQAGWLRTLMWEQSGLEVNKSRWLVVWADNSFSFCDDLDAATAAVAGSLLTAGPMMALDLYASGYNLVELAGRPFASLEMDMEEKSQ